MNPAQHVLRGLVLGYRWFISPILPGGCRYQPSCSKYALEAITRHGAVRGFLLTIKRLGRCHPWGGWGYDPVPERSSHNHCRRTSATHRLTQKKGH